MLSCTHWSEVIADCWRCFTTMWRRFKVMKWAQISTYNVLLLYRPKQNMLAQIIWTWQVFQNHVVCKTTKSKKYAPYLWTLGASPVLGLDWIGGIWKRNCIFKCVYIFCLAQKYCVFLRFNPFALNSMGFMRVIVLNWVRWRKLYNLENTRAFLKRSDHAT